MFIQFTVKNFKSFKDEATLSLVASSIKERMDENTLSVSKNPALLKSAVIYGANASGKSNLLKAMGFMKGFILNSSKETQVSEKIMTERYKLHTATESQPSFFEIIFIHDKTRYRYGFAVSEKEVKEEWLYYVPNVQELKVFTRKGQNFDLSRHFKSEEPLVRTNRIRPNALLLSVSAQFNGEMAVKIMRWLSSFNCISGIDNWYASVTVSMLEKEKGRNTILDFLKKADMGIEDFSLIKTKLSELDKTNLPPGIARFSEKAKETIRIEVMAVRKKYNSKGKVAGLTNFDMGKEESHGTRKFFELSGPIINTLLNGKVLVVDELDTRLHPKLIRAICELFNSKKLNPRNAQLIFVSHNTNILDKDLFRRDQIWFMEKNKYGASELFSLVEFKDRKNGKKVRNDASYERSYLKGIYGSVPCVRELEVEYGDG